MSLLYRFNSMALTSVLLAVTAFCIADGAVWLGAVAVPLVMFGWYAGRERPITTPASRTHGAGGGGTRGTAGSVARTRPWTMPRLLTNLLVFGAIVNAAFRAFSMGTGSPLVSQLGAFLVQVQIIKLFDRRTPRDDGQVLSLSLFIVIATILTDNTLAVGLLLAVYTPLAIGAMMLLQLRAGPLPREARAAVDGTDVEHDGSAGGRRLGLATGHNTARHFIRLVGAIVLTTVALAVVLFFVTPQGFGATALGNFGLGREGRVGFTDQIQLGRIGSLSDSPTPVFDMLVHDSSGVNIGSPDRSIYLRGAISDEYDTETYAWRSTPASSRRFGMEDLVPGLTTRLSDDAPGTFLEALVITPRSWSRAQGPLFAAWRPIKIEADQPLRITIGRDFTIQHDVSKTSRFRYTVWSSRMDTVDTGAIGLPPNASFDNPRVRSLAHEIIRAAHLPGDIRSWDAAARRAVVIALRDHLRTRYAYSLEGLAPPAGVDPIEWFLFERKAGHCEYFASAMVGMCQSVGIPARLVAGYVATEFNSTTRYYLIRESNAHAWVEAYLGDGRWIADVDPSPPDEIERIHRPQAGVMATLRRWYEALEFNWANSVVGFDVSQQARLFDAGQSRGATGRGVATTLGRWGRNVLQALRLQHLADRISPGATFLFGVGSIAAAGLILFARAVRRRKARRKRRWTIDPDAAALLPQVSFFPHALRTLDRAGLGKPDSRTPLSHARKLRAFDPELADSFALLADSYQRVRFAGKPLSETEIRTAADAVHVLTRRAALLGSRARTRRGHRAGTGDNPAV